MQDEGRARDKGTEMAECHLAQRGTGESTGGETAQ